MAIRSLWSTKGAAVSAWTNTGQGFAQIPTVEDSAFAGGQAGIEGAGNITRLTNFKAGVPHAPVKDMSAAIEALAVNDAFATDESPLSGKGAWASLALDYSSFSASNSTFTGGFTGIDGEGERTRLADFSSGPPAPF
jgi:hypothetical protein